MKVVTTVQMRRIDEIAINERKIAGSALMDRAGKAVAREALDRFAPDSVAVVTGKGNNAGDGFVVARELTRHDIHVTLVMLESPDKLTGDALDAYQKVPESLRRIIQPPAQELRAELAHHDLIIDAIFGTGIRGPAQAPWADYIAAINESGVNVLSVDIPSGLPGEPVEEPPHVRATATVTIGLPKLGLVMGPGVLATGQVIVADIGFPRDLLEDDKDLTVNLMDIEAARALLPPRPPDGNKGTFGRVMILGGSEGMTGAAVMAARAAARSGVGLVYSCYPGKLGQIMESHLIEPVKLPLPGKEKWFAEAMASRAAKEAERMDAVAIGPGFGAREGTGKFLRAILEQVKAPLVIDADGLNLLAQDLEVLARRPGPTVLTPHPGEAARLLGKPIKEIQSNRLDVFMEMSRRYQAVVVLKGAQTIVTEPGGQRSINPTGNSGLAKGGSGDVLTGLIAGLLAQGATAYDAARLGVFLHGLAADVLAESTSTRAMIPGDLIEALGLAFMKLEKQ